MNDAYSEALIMEIRALGHTIAESSARLSDDIQSLIRATKETRMAERDALERLRVAVERNSNLQQSAVEMIKGFATQIRQAAESASGDDVTADLNTLADSMDQQAAAFSEALAANTPAQA